MKGILKLKNAFLIIAVLALASCAAESDVPSASDSALPNAPERGGPSAPESGAGAPLMPGYGSQQQQ
jgi:hypothetical protein